MQIVIIGNSAAGLSALEAFRKKDQSSKVTLVTQEEERPYSRVLLPYYLRGKVPYENLFIRDENYYARMNAKCIIGKVVKLLPEKQSILLEKIQNSHCGATLHPFYLDCIQAISLWPAWTYFPLKSHFYQ